MNMKQMTHADWIFLSSFPPIVRNITEDRVLPLYGSVASQFAAWKPLSWDNCVVGLHIVYAWMPTMMDYKRPADLTPAQRTTVVNLFNDARARRLTNDELLQLRAFP